MNVRLFVWSAALILCMLLWPLVSGTHADDAAEVTNKLRLLAEARDANGSQLKSAFASGTVVSSVQNAADIAPTVILDSDIQIFYDRPRFRIHLVHTTNLIEQPKPAGVEPAGFERWVPSELCEQVVIFDGEQLYSIEYFDDASCRGTIFFGFAKMAVMRKAGFPFDSPVELWTQALKIEGLDAKHTSLAPISEGGLVGTVTKNTYRMKFFLLNRFDYDLRRVSSYRTGESQPFRDYLLSWHNSNGVFYVDRFVNTVTSASGDTASSAQNSRKLTVHFDQFEANLQVEPSVFDLKSVAIPEGTLFTDRRSTVEGGPKTLVIQDKELEVLVK